MQVLCKFIYFGLGSRCRLLQLVKCVEYVCVCLCVWLFKEAFIRYSFALYQCERVRVRRQRHFNTRICIFLSMTEYCYTCVCVCKSC